MKSSQAKVKKPFLGEYLILAFSTWNRVGFGVKVTQAMREELISERLEPVMAAVDARRIVIGAPLLPTKFVWRGAEYTVAEVLEEWKETGPCHHGSGERYVRKHWFRLRMASGEQFKVYFERHARSAKQMKQRWWLYTMATE